MISLSPKNMYPILLLSLVSISLLTLPISLLAAPAAFTPPTPEQRIAALGDLSSLSPADQTAFLAQLTDFTPIRIPEDDDWLAVHPEPGQTFDQYLAAKFPTPSDSEPYLYLQPIGDFPQGSVDFETLSTYCRIFFNTETKTAAPIALPLTDVRTRTNGFTQATQLHAGDILKSLNQSRPDDAFAVIAFTLTDLYPDDSWNFVFGLADYRKGVGVFSFARYGDPDTPRFRERALKVMSHEIGHMYGILHCTHFSCLMNGANGLWETDAAPLHLCPVCLRKLHHSTHTDLLQRYSQLNAFYKTHSLEDAQLLPRARIQLLLNSSQ